MDYVYVYLHVCLRRLRLSERSGQKHTTTLRQNEIQQISEAHRLQKQRPRNKSVTKKNFFFNSQLLSQLKRRKDLICSVDFVLLYFFPSVRTDLRCFLLTFSLNMTKIWVASLHHLRSALLPLSAQAGVTVYVELTFGERRPSNVQVLTASSRHQRAPSSDVSVTKNPRSPKVWSVAVSSRGGRGGNRNTSRSFLCLGKETGWKRVDIVENVTSLP